MHRLGELELHSLLALILHGALQEWNGLDDMQAASYLQMSREGTQFLARLPTGTREALMVDPLRHDVDELGGKAIRQHEFAPLAALGDHDLVRADQIGRVGEEIFGFLGLHGGRILDEVGHIKFEARFEWHIAQLVGWTGLMPTVPDLGQLRALFRLEILDPVATKLPYVARKEGCMLTALRCVIVDGVVSEKVVDEVLQRYARVIAL